MVARLSADGRSAVERALEQVEKAASDGVDITFDMHARLFGATNLSAVLPPWALDGGKLKIEERLRYHQRAGECVGIRTSLRLWRAETGTGHSARRRIYQKPSASAPARFIPQLHTDWEYQLLCDIC